MANILIVDDNQDLLDFFSIFLKINHHEVHTASSKEKVLGQLETFIPDLILIDVRLNGISGRELCKQIKKRHEDKNIPIILLSASPELLIDYQECLADDIIEKPFDIDTVRMKIDNLIKN